MVRITHSQRQQTGEIYAWGWNYYGQIGCSDDELILTRVEGLNDEKITMISCGTFHSIALTEKGRVFSWGDNSFGQLGIKDIEFSNKPQEIQLTIVRINFIFDMKVLYLTLFFHSFH